MLESYGCTRNLLIVASGKIALGQIGWCFLKIWSKSWHWFSKNPLNYFFQTEVSGDKAGFQCNFRSKSLKFLRQFCVSYTKVIKTTIVSFIKSLSLRETFNL